MGIPTSVTIREVGPREGLQTQSGTVPTKDKIEFINGLTLTGLREIEVTSFVRPDRVPQMADAEDVLKGIERKKGVKYSALYLNQKGFERAEAAGANNRGWIYTAASEIFLRKNNNTSHDEILKSLPSWVEVFKKHEKKLHGVMVSTAFGCNYEGRVKPKTVLSRVETIVAAAKEVGQYVKEVSLADTMGWGTPEKVRATIAEVQSKFPDIEVSLHLHDTRGMGIANAYAGLLEGVTIFESSIAGVGGCPFVKGAAGNVCTEDLVFLMHELGIVTGIDLDILVEVAWMVPEFLGLDAHGKLARVQSKI